MSQDVRNYFLRNTQDEFIVDDDDVICRECNGKPCDWTRYGSEIVALLGIGVTQKKKCL